VRFDQAFTFQYSPRPGTPAAELVDRFIPPEVVAERYGRLETMVREHSRERHERLVGTTQELLIESPSKTDRARWSGRTRGNHLVHLPAPEVADGAEPPFAPGDLVTTTVLEAAVNYNIAGPAEQVRRTAAGRATAAALARGEDWRVDTLVTPTTPPGTVGLPVVSAMA